MDQRPATCPTRRHARRPRHRPGHEPQPAGAGPGRRHPGRAPGGGGGERVAFDDVAADVAPGTPSPPGSGDGRRAHPPPAGWTPRPPEPDEHDAHVDLDPPAALDLPPRRSAPWSGARASPATSPGSTRPWPAPTASPGTATAPRPPRPVVPGAALAAPPLLRHPARLPRRRRLGRRRGQRPHLGGEPLQEPVQAGRLVGDGLAVGQAQEGVADPAEGRDLDGRLGGGVEQAAVGGRSRGRRPRWWRWRAGRGRCRGRRSGCGGRRPARPGPPPP